MHRTLGKTCPSCGLQAWKEVKIGNKDQSAWPVSEALNISYERVLHIVPVDLEVRKISVKWIFKYPNVEEKHVRADASRSVCTWFE